MDKENNKDTYYLGDLTNLNELKLLRPMKDINEKPNYAFKFDGMTAYVYDLSNVWEVHVRIWEDEPEPEGNRVDKMIDYMQHEGFFASNDNPIQVWVVGIKR